MKSKIVSILMQTIWIFSWTHSQGHPNVTSLFFWPLGNGRFLFFTQEEKVHVSSRQTRSAKEKNVEKHKALTSLG